MASPDRDRSIHPANPNYANSDPGTTALDDRHREEAGNGAGTQPPRGRDSSAEQDRDPRQDRGLGATLKQYWWLLPVLGLVLAIGGLTYLRLRQDEPAAQTETTPLSVQTVVAEQEPIRAWVSSEGNVRAAEYQHLTFESEGEVTYLADRGGRRLREGDRVTAGELLARIDDRELVADLRQAEAAVAEAQQQRSAAAAQVAQAQTGVAQARTQVQEAQARLQNAQSAQNLAATNVERYRSLASQGAISQLEFDQRQNTLDDAQAQVQVAQAGVLSSQEQVASAQAQVTAAQQQLAARESAISTAQARLSQAQVALEGASIYAPYDGLIAYLNITEGEYFSPQIVTSQLGGDYQGILERIPMVIIDPAQYEVLVDLAGPTGEQVAIGQAALIASETVGMDTGLGMAQGSGSQGMDGQTLEANARARGEVFAVNPAISPGGRAIEARVRLDPTTTQDVRHGEQVLTWIAVAADPDAVVVPLNAVVRREQVPYVFVVDPDQGVVEQRQVELGITGIAQQAILQGVEPWESVVTAGQNRLVDGAAVQVLDPENGGAL